MNLSNPDFAQPKFPHYGISSINEKCSGTNRIVIQVAIGMKI